MKITSLGYGSVNQTNQNKTAFKGSVTVSAKSLTPSYTKAADMIERELKTLVGEKNLSGLNDTSSRTMIFCRKFNEQVENLLFRLRKKCNEAEGVSVSLDLS